MTNTYTKAALGLLADIQKNLASKVEEVAKLMKKTIDSGGMVFVFGAGHSSILTEEMFHRAGGLIPVNPILHTFLSPHISSKIAGKLERLEGVAPVLYARSGIRKGDMIWIASNSGINAAAIEMAAECKKNGIPVVALTSLGHSQKIQSRHATGKKLYELADIVLDNHCPVGDALVDFSEVRVAAGSSLANNFIYHWALCEACELWKAEGKTLPIYRSANLPGGDEYNEKMEASYRSRNPLL